MRKKCNPKRILRKINYVSEVQIKEAANQNRKKTGILKKTGIQTA